MKIKLLISVVLVLLFSQYSYAKKDESGNTNSVRGYTKKDGTYVAPHKRTNPNGTQRDNWSSKPNYNPYTGKEGKKEPQK
ncbi:MAG: hypothetical protein Q7K13_06195 [Polynucleobacter sp.]|uniref:hypothetical protein n=1 Tax=Polynucleobacter sp. TaxID=2029855 RepID=UPI00271DD39F|nr:hypothetical protein [Polynucleobacter sp.]MDO8714053.1 hypothetical protein [Polynucleobacter sp.]